MNTKKRFSVEVETTHHGGQQWTTEWTITAASEGTSATRAFSGHKRSLTKAKAKDRTKIVSCVFRVQRTR